MTHTSSVSPCKKRFRFKDSYLSYILMYSFFFGANAFFSGLISVYLLGKGYTASQVSFVVSCSFVVCLIVQPLFGHLSDRFPPRLVTGVFLTGSAVTGILFLFAQNIWAIALLYSLTVALNNSGSPVVERIATRSRLPYRYIRIWGTIGYAVCFQLSGVIYKYLSPKSMFLFFALGVSLCILGLWGLGDGPKQEKPLNKPDTKKKAPLWTRHFIFYILIVCVFNGISSVSSTYLPAMFQSEGIPIDLVSTVISALTLSELPLILLSHKFMDRFSNTQLLSAGFLMSALQYAAYSLVPVPAVQVVAAILLKATSGMVFIMLNLKVVASIVGEDRQITALALVATFKSLSSVLFQMAGGMLLEQMSYAHLYFLLMIASAAGVLLCLSSRLPDGREIRMFS